MSPATVVAGMLSVRASGFSSRTVTVYVFAASALAARKMGSNSMVAGSTSMAGWRDLMRRVLRVGNIQKDLCGWSVMVLVKMRIRRGGRQQQHEVWSETGKR